MGIVVCSGMYSEVKDAYIEWDGDYLRGRIILRQVANSFDNIVEHDFPDSYGYFMQGVLDMGDVGALQGDMKKFLKQSFGYSDEMLDLLSIRFIHPDGNNK